MNYIAGCATCPRANRDWERHGRIRHRIYPTIRLTGRLTSLASLAYVLQMFLSQRRPEIAAIGRHSGPSPHDSLGATESYRAAHAVQVRTRTAGAFLAMVLACTAPVGDTAKAADTAESSDREVTIHFLEPDEIEAVKAFIKTGDLDDARQHAGAIETPRYRIIALGYVAEAFAKRGEFGKAEAIGLSLTISTQRDWVLVYAVMGAVSHYADAETTDILINAISAPPARTRALCIVALGELVRGQGADAEHTTLRAASEAQQIVAPNDVAEMNGWIAALSGELGRPPSLETVLESPSWFGAPSPAYFITATSSAEMLDTIARARASLKAGTTPK